MRFRLSSGWPLLVGGDAGEVLACVVAEGCGLFEVGEATWSNEDYVPSAAIITIEAFC
jgi:hypothetical protein